MSWDGYEKMAAGWLTRNPTTDLTLAQLTAALQAFDESSTLDWSVESIARAVIAAQAVTP